MTTRQKQAVCDRMIDRIETKFRAGEIGLAERDKRLAGWLDAWTKWAVELARESARRAA